MGNICACGKPKDEDGDTSSDSQSSDIRSRENSGQAFRSDVSSSSLQSEFSK